MGKRRAQSCLTCRHRQWRQIDGFMVLGCPLHVMRFGIMPDLQRGRVNRAGNCVPMPRMCKDYERSGPAMQPGAGAGA